MFFWVVVCEDGRRRLEAVQAHLLCHDSIDLVEHLVLVAGLIKKRHYNRTIKEIFDPLARSDVGASFSIASLRDFWDCEVESSAGLRMVVCKVKVCETLTN